MQGRSPTDLEIESVDGLVVVVIQLARVGPAELEGLRGPLLDLPTADHPRLLLDLAAVEYLCSAALGVILGMSRGAADHGGRLVLCNLRADVRETFLPLPSKQVLRPDWRGPFFAGTSTEGLSL